MLRRSIFPSMTLSASTFQLRSAASSAAKVKSKRIPAPDAKKAASGAKRGRNPKNPPILPTASSSPTTALAVRGDPSTAAAAAAAANNGNWVTTRTPHSTTHSASMKDGNSSAYISVSYSSNNNVSDGSAFPTPTKRGRNKKSTTAAVGSDAGAPVQSMATTVSSSRPPVHGPPHQTPAQMLATMMQETDAVFKNDPFFSGGGGGPFASFPTAGGTFGLLGQHPFFSTTRSVLDDARSFWDGDSHRPAALLGHDEKQVSASDEAKAKSDRVANMPEAELVHDKDAPHAAAHLPIKKETTHGGGKKGKQVTPKRVKVGATKN